MVKKLTVVSAFALAATSSAIDAANVEYHPSRFCKNKCNELVSDLPQGLDCRQYRMMLPRPKVGKACTSAYDDGAYAACTRTCDSAEGSRGGPEKNGLTGSFCRSYMSEFPKPTVHKACRQGYQMGYDKSLAMAKAYDWNAHKPKPDADAPPVTMETKREAAPAKAADRKEPEKAPEPEPEPEPEPAAAEPKLLVNMPVTVDDREIFLQIWEGDDSNVKIAAFCDEHMSDSAESCIKQLTPHVNKKLNA